MPAAPFSTVKPLASRYRTMALLDLNSRKESSAAFQTSRLSLFVSSRFASIQSNAAALSGSSGGAPRAPSSFNVDVSTKLLDAFSAGATVGALQNSMVKEVNIATRRMDNSRFWLIAREFSPVAAGTQQFASVVCRGTSQNVGYSEPIVTAPGRLSPMLVQPPLAPKHRRL